MDFSSVLPLKQSGGGDLGRKKENNMTEGLFSVESRKRLTDTVTHKCYTSTVFSSVRRKACLIFLSTRVNIWHKEALDSSRTIQVRHRRGRGHERGPSWVQLAPGSSFKQPNPSSFTLTHAHTLLVYVHALCLRCTNMHINAKYTPLKTMCKMSVMWRHVPNNVRQLVVYCKTQEFSLMKALRLCKWGKMKPEVFWKTKTFREMDNCTASVLPSYTW